MSTPVVVPNVMRNTPPFGSYIGESLTPSMTDLAIDIQNVAKRYAEHVAVRDLSLAVPRGSVYGLLGPNGAGKTTTIRMILNIIIPDSGTISLLGKSNRDTGVTD